MAIQNQTEKEITDYISSENFNLHLVEIAAKVAILCKEMGLPFYETKGKFEQAINLAKAYDTSVKK